MTRFILKRLVATIPVMLVASLAIFLLLHLTPGDPAAVIAGEQATRDDIIRIRSQLGFDRPLYEQFALWLLQLVQGNLGVSIYSNQPVLKLIGQRVEPTLSLALVTLVTSVIIALTLGVAAAWRAGSGGDRAVMFGAVLGFSVPSFVVGYGLVFLFSVTLGWFPVQGYQPLANGVGPWLRHLTLPALALGTGYIALIARVTRASLLEALSEDYVRTARAKGAPERRVMLLHALGNAAVPIITVIGLGVALLIGGVVVTETVFNIPGVGRLTVDAIARRDYPVIQGIVLVFSAVYVAVNLCVDLSYALLDPRIRY